MNPIRMQRKHGRIWLYALTITCWALIIVRFWCVVKQISSICIVELPRRSWKLSTIRFGCMAVKWAQPQINEVAAHHRKMVIQTIRHYKLVPFVYLDFGWIHLSFYYKRFFRFSSQRLYRKNVRATNTCKHKYKIGVHHATWMTNILIGSRTFEIYTTHISAGNIVSDTPGITHTHNYDKSFILLLKFWTQFSLRICKTLEWSMEVDKSRKTNTQKHIHNLENKRSHATITVTFYIFIYTQVAWGMNENHL